MKILIGYDGSQPAQDALKDLARAGLPPKAQACVLVAVAPIISPQAFLLGMTAIAWYPEATAEMGRINEKAESEAQFRARKAVSSLKQRFPSWSVTVEISHAVPAAAILAKADAWKPDLIVLGSRGMGRLGRALIGSVALQVLHHAHCDVRIGKSRSGRSAGPPRVLVGFDGSSHARAAIAAVARRHWPKGTQVRLVAVMDLRLHPDLARPRRAEPGALASRPDDPWSRVEERLEAAAEKLAGKGLRATPIALPGEPRRVLLAEAKAMRADGIFLGSKGLSGFQRLLLGSVSSAVAAHAPCSVEIIRKLPVKKA